MWSKCQVAVFGSEIHWVDTLSESGVVWVLYRSFVTGVTNAGLAIPERWFPVAKKQRGANGVLSLAEQLLARQKDAAGRTHEAYDEDWANLTPNVLELLSRVLVDDKKVLEPATVLIFARSGSWHSCLSHKGLKLKWWGEGGTIAACLADLERACRQEMGQDTSEQPGTNTGPGRSGLATGD
jgi:hypothetical protein